MCYCIFFSCSSNDESLNENITLESNIEEEFSTMIESFLEDSEKASKAASGRRLPFKTVDCSDLRFITRFDIYNRATVINSKFKYKFGNKTYAIVKKNRTGVFILDYQVYGICGSVVVFPPTNTNTTIDSELVGLWQVTSSDNTPRNQRGLTVRIKKNGDVIVQGCNSHSNIKITEQEGFKIKFDTSRFSKTSDYCADKRDDYAANIINTLSNIRSYQRIGKRISMVSARSPYLKIKSQFRLNLRLIEK